MPDSLGPALREARRNFGLSFRRFARQAGFSESHLRSIENGHRSVTDDIAAAYDRVLATGGEFASAAARTRDPGAPAPGPQAPVPWDQPGTLAVLTGLTSGGEVDRRRFVAASGAALTVLARSELALIVRLLRVGSYTGQTGRRLYALAAEASRQAAWDYFDQDNHPAARHYFETALRASATAGDPVTGAYALSFAAVQCYSTGQPRDAVALLEAASDTVARTGTPKMTAMLAARSARAHSKTGSRHDCAHLLHQARTALDLGPHPCDPPVLYWVTHGEIEMIAGSSALDLGDPARPSLLRRRDRRRLPRRRPVPAQPGHLPRPRRRGAPRAPRPRRHPRTCPARRALPRRRRLGPLRVGDHGPARQARAARRLACRTRVPGRDPAMTRWSCHPAGCSPGSSSSSRSTAAVTCSSRAWITAMPIW